MSLLPNPACPLLGTGLSTRLVDALRALAKGLSCAVAAVELLIDHTVWLRRNDFVDRFVDTADCLVGGTVLAWVKWRAVVRALDAGRLPCSGSEAQVLRIATRA